MNDRIVFDDSIHHGKPVIKNTRVPVATILSALAGGMATAEITREYEIEQADIEAALLYAADLIERERVIALA
jgi:uncharacterized protein (DUF433 family)